MELVKCGWPRILIMLRWISVVSKLWNRDKMWNERLSDAVCKNNIELGFCLLHHYVLD